MENQRNAVVSENTQNVFSQTINFKNELTHYSKNELLETQSKLNALCLSYDPYQPELMTAEDKMLIQEFNLEETLSNPFEFTNIILQYLDLIESKLNLIQ